MKLKAYILSAILSSLWHSAMAYIPIEVIEGSWNAWDIFTGLDPRLSHVPKWRPREIAFPSI